MAATASSLFIPMPLLLLLLLMTIALAFGWKKGWLPLCVPPALLTEAWPAEKTGPLLPGRVSPAVGVAPPLALGTPLLGPLGRALLPPVSLLKKPGLPARRWAVGPWPLGMCC